MSDQNHAVPAPGAGATLSVLVVEDNPVNMRLMRLILRARGHTVYEVGDGEDALVFLMAHRPDVVLLDMQLPGIDGFSLAARIKSRVETERIPIVAVTSYAMAGDEERALASGCDAYLSKPIDDAELLATIEAVTAEKIGEVRQVSEGGARILVVDDEARNARLLRMMLSVQGYTVVTAGDGPTALGVVEAGQCDLVLLDVMMPGWDGFEVCRRIRARELETYGHAPVLPVVMVTALGAGEDRAKGLDAGADDFLTKPVNDIELLARVRSLLRIKTLHDALEARNRLLFDALQRAVSAPVAAQIMEDPARYLRPGGERRTVSVLFADLRGYSTIAEEVAPSEAMTVLNSYLGRLIEVVYRHGGTVNQLLGDGIMSLFGAPVSYGDDTWRAVQAALDMRDEIVTLEPPGLPHIRLAMGIGITTGEAVVGHIGSEKRIDYTAVGDVVNLAARFQDHAGPGQILITAPTYDRVKDYIAVADAGTQSVKGRLGWAQAYSVLGRARPGGAGASDPADSV